MILTALRQHAQRQPDAVALTDETHSVTYEALVSRVSMTADWLTAEGVRVVGIALDNTIDWIIADLAAIQAGITSVPIASFFSPEQIAHVRREARIDLMISPPGDMDVPGLDGGRGSRLLTSNGDALPAKISFTSGSTGTPKGAVIRHDDIARVCAGIVSALADLPIERHLCLLPLATLLENIAGVYAPLMKGIEVIVPSPATVGLAGSSSLDANALAACLNLYQPHSVILVPQLALALVTLREFELITTDGLLMAAVGGGRVSTDLLARAERLGIPLYEGYGLTEAGSVCTLNLPGATRPGTVGRPLPHVEVRLADSGELLIKGPLMQGYLGEENRTGQWLATGDLAGIDEDGFVTVRGRIKNTFITAYGRNINPEWVEAELAQQLAVDQAVFLGEARATNLALIWPRFERDNEAINRLIGELNARLPDYARVHDYLLFDEPMPRELLTSNGRIRRDAVIRRFTPEIERHYQALSAPAGRSAAPA